jgi:hypothetical protein
MGFFSPKLFCFPFPHEIREWSYLEVQLLLAEEDEPCTLACEVDRRDNQTS